METNNINKMKKIISKMFLYINVLVGFIAISYIFVFIIKSIFTSESYWTFKQEIMYDCNDELKLQIDFKEHTGGLSDMDLYIDFYPKSELKSNIRYNLKILDFENNSLKFEAQNITYESGMYFSRLPFLKEKYIIEIQYFSDENKVKKFKFINAIMSV